MITRRSVWSQPEVQKLLAQFVPAADEVWGLQNRDDPASLLFQKVAEQGHYAGRTKPTNTRQGIYATAPSGRLLASVNTRSAERVSQMLERALAAWDALPESDRYLADPELESVLSAWGAERLYPEGGLALQIFARDLPRDKTIGDWRDAAWNRDFVWFRRDEMLTFVPGGRDGDAPEVGDRTDVPETLVSRLASLHLVDFVRGQVTLFADSNVEIASMVSSVIGVDGQHVRLQLEGRSRAVHHGAWPVAGYEDMHNPKEQERGVQTQLLGYATFDLASKRFTDFQLLSIGTRWGGTQYNGRSGDLEPGPIGFLFVPADPDLRVPPSSVWRYGWQ